MEAPKETRALKLDEALFKTLMLHQFSPFWVRRASAQSRKVELLALRHASRNFMTWHSLYYGGKGFLCVIRWLSRSMQYSLAIGRRCRRGV